MTSNRAAWRALLLAPLATVGSFGIVLWVAYAWCVLSNADCNPAAFLLLPIVAVAMGVPIMLLICAAVLLPLSRKLARQGKSAAAALIVTGSFPGIVLTGLFLLHQGETDPVRVFGSIAYVMIGVGVPGAIGGYVFHRLTRGADGGRRWR